MALFYFLPKEEQYFSLFSQMTSYISDAARALVEMYEVIWENREKYCSSFGRKLKSAIETFGSKITRLEIERNGNIVERPGVVHVKNRMNQYDHERKIIFCASC